MAVQFDWSAWAAPLLATAVGALIATATSYWAIRTTFRLQSQETAATRRRDEALAAYRVLQSLLDSHAELYTSQIHIDESFEQAKQDGLAHLEPWQKVQSLVGGGRRLEPIDAVNVNFLIDVREATLINEIQLAQRRAAALQKAMEKYSEFRQELTDFAISSSDSINMSDGTLASSEFTGATARVVQLKEAVVQNLLGSIIERLKPDSEEVWRVAERLHGLAIEYFGDDYPQVKIERV